MAYLMRTTLLVAVVLSAGGCAFLRGSAQGSAFVENDMRHLRLPGAGPSNAPAVVFRDPFEYQEYSRSQTNGRAEAVFFQAQGHGTALNLDPANLEQLNSLWAINRSARTLTWRQPRATRVPGSDIHYRRYRVRDADGRAERHCAAFLRAWDHDSLDPSSRPDKGYFGYYCRPAGTALSAAEAERYLRRIEIASPPPLGFHIGQQVPHDATALPTARGRTAAGWGIPDFPLPRTRHYPIGGPYGNSH